MTARGRRRPGRPRLGDDGAVGGAEVLPLAVLTFVVGTMLVANLWAVVDARFAVDAAAREAGRRYVEAPDAASARAAAERAAAEALAGHGRDPSRATVTVAHPDGRDWGACVPTAVTVRHPVRIQGVPGLGGRRLVTVTATHHQVVDPWRSGVDDRGGCR